MPQLNTLVPDILELFNPDKGHEIDERSLEAFADDLKQVLRIRLAQRENNRDPLRFSSLGKKDRQLWYEAHPIDGGRDELTAKTYLKFLYGDVIEALLLFLAKESGHEVTQQQAEVECDGVLGHIDAIIDGTVVDVKSASPFGYKKFRDGTVPDEDPFGYVAQLSGYSNILTPDQGAAWLAMDKVSGDICVSRLSHSITSAHDPRPRIAHLKDVIAKDEPPERCYKDVEDGKSGNRKLGVGCSYCHSKSRCWPQLRTFLYSTGPRYLTTVVRPPDVPEVVLGSAAEPEMTD